MEFDSGFTLPYLYTHTIYNKWDKYKKDINDSSQKVQIVQMEESD